MDGGGNNNIEIPQTTQNGETRVLEAGFSNKGAPSHTYSPLATDPSAIFDKGSAEGCRGEGLKGADDEVIEVEQTTEKRLYYKVSESPPLRLVLLFALQGPSTTYIIPLFAMMAMEEWKCPSQQDLVAYYSNSTTNLTITDDSLLPVPKDFIYHRMRQLCGSLMVAGGIHFAMGVTGLVGFMLRFIGPITIVPAITLVGLYIYKVTVKFCETNWPVAFIVFCSGITLSMYLSKLSTPIPAWNRRRGFHLKWYPFHQVFAILISIIIGWGVSAIFTYFDLLSKDRNSVQFYARTDTQLHIIHDTPWFSFPYPGQFGSPLFHAGVFLSFFLATLLSVLDSIGDYAACARMCWVPRPPDYAVNRGIALEGLMSLLSGAMGTGQATVSYGMNIGAIGLSKVASRRVFQAVGLMYVLLAVFTKVGAVFITIPYSVLGGTQIITFGIFIGIVLSNLQLVDLKVTRNVAIIGISLLMGLMIPYWTAKTPEGIQTGNPEADRMISILLSNPVFVGGLLACFLDNTVPGTLKERGIILEDSSPESKNKTPLKGDDEEKTIPVNDNKNDDDDDDDEDGGDFEEGLEVYELPWIPDSIQRSWLAKVVRIFPGEKVHDGNPQSKKPGYTGMKM